jgi:hypothetical protein
LINKIPSPGTEERACVGDKSEFTNAQLHAQDWHFHEEVVGPAGEMLCGRLRSIIISTNDFISPMLHLASDHIPKPFQTAFQVFIDLLRVASFQVTSSALLASEEQAPISRTSCEAAKSAGI